MLLLRVIIVVVQVGAMKICVTTLEAQIKGKTKNVVKAFRKNVSSLRYVVINLR
jgi:hypothetical protein